MVRDSSSVKLFHLPEFESMVIWIRLLFWIKSFVLNLSGVHVKEIFIQQLILNEIITPLYVLSLNFPAPTGV